MKSDKISCPYFLIFPEYRPIKSVTDGPRRFIVLNDSAIPKTVIKIYFNFLLKDLELFEYCRSNSYTTANKNFVQFADL